jgi:hypothetical protein
VGVVRGVWVGGVWVGDVRGWVEHWQVWGTLRVAGSGCKG